MDDQNSSRSARDEEVGSSYVNPLEIERYQRAVEALRNSKAVPIPEQIKAKVDKNADDAAARREADKASLQAELSRQDQIPRS